MNPTHRPLSFQHNLRQTCQNSKAKDHLQASKPAGGRREGKDRSRDDLVWRSGAVRGSRGRWRRSSSRGDGRRSRRRGGGRRRRRLGGRCELGRRPWPGWEIIIKAFFAGWSCFRTKGGKTTPKYLIVPPSIISRLINDDLSFRTILIRVDFLILIFYKIQVFFVEYTGILSIFNKMLMEKYIFNIQ